MARLEQVRPADLTAEQKRMYDIIVGTRATGLGGPFSVLVRTPYIAEPANGLHNAFRLTGKLDRRVFELLVCMVARECGAEYAWAVHEELARKAGLAPDVIVAVRERRMPGFAHDDERLIYDLTTQLLKTKTLNEATYRRAVAALGVDLLIEVTSAVGFYSMVCMLLNTFGVAAPGGERPLGSVDG
jgi:4-carboxymuconolactone decarboxylase